MLNSISSLYFTGSKSVYLYIISAISIFFGIYIIISKNPILSVLFLIGLFCSVSVYLMIIGLHFIGLSYLLVYVGAISILFLFILMLINIRVSELLTDNRNSTFLAILAILCFNYSVTDILPYSISVYDFINGYTSSILKSFNIILYMPVSGLDLSALLVKYLYLFNVVNVESKSWDTLLIVTSHITSIGNILYTNLFILFIVVSLILLLAMVGAIVITINKSGSNKIKSHGFVNTHNESTIIWVFDVMDYHVIVDVSETVLQLLTSINVDNILDNTVNALVNGAVSTSKFLIDQTVTGLSYGFKNFISNGYFLDSILDRNIAPDTNITVYSLNTDGITPSMGNSMGNSTGSVATNWMENTDSYNINSLFESANNNSTYNGINPAETNYFWIPQNQYTGPTIPNFQNSNLVLPEAPFDITDYNWLIDHANSAVRLLEGLERIVYRDYPHIMSYLDTIYDTLGINASSFVTRGDLTALLPSWNLDLNYDSLMSLFRLISRARFALRDIWLTLDAIDANFNTTVLGNNLMDIGRTFYQDRYGEYSELYFHLQDFFNSLIRLGLSSDDYVW